MNAADIDAVTAIDGLCYSEPWPAETWRDELDYPYSRHLVARMPAGSGARPGEVVGHAGLLLDGDTAHVTTLAVHPRRRAAGIATTLLRELLGCARSAGATSAMLEVRASARGVQRLYGRLGFVPVAVERSYYVRPSENAVVMWLPDLDDAAAESPVACAATDGPVIAAAADRGGPS